MHEVDDKDDKLSMIEEYPVADYVHDWLGAIEALIVTDRCNVLPAMTTLNAVVFSIQVSSGHHATKASKGDRWDTVEVYVYDKLEAIPNDLGEQLAEYADKMPNGWIFHYVPVDLVNRLIERFCGIDWQRSLKNVAKSLADEIK